LIKVNSLAVKPVVEIKYAYLKKCFIFIPDIWLQLSECAKANPGEDKKQVT